ncbi:phage portal protein [Methylocella silvestris]|uniref:Phage portal protein n=1 Tax=Methylocella silvestris TaxID=199596 RepID=A0A2J7TJS3_METSI|nr:phage portal protein [Methylocella silvestris]PNG27013.1 phage portal protein [Methylocella silvestris]
MFGFGARKKQRPALAAPRQLSTREFEAMRAPVMAATATVPIGDPNAWDILFGKQQPGISPESAMAHGAFYRCISLIAGSIAMLDFNTFRVNPDDGHRERDIASPAARLISVRPNDRYSTTMLWRSVVADMLRHGNGIVWIQRKRDGTPIALEYIPWLRTAIRLDSIDGEPVQIYGLTRDSGQYVLAHSDDVLHIPGSPVWQLFRAMSPLTAYAMSVGIAISADAFAKAYFDNGSSPDGYLKYPASFKHGKDQADEIRQTWMARFGGRNRFLGPAILNDGGEYVPVSPINAADAQLIDARKIGVSDIGRIMGVPDHMLNMSDKATSFGKGLEELTQSFVDFTLGQHLKAIEDEVNYKLVRQSTKVAEFDREGFVRGDLKSRMEAFQIAMGGAQGPGSMTANEVRQKMNLGRSKDPNADRLITWPSSPTATQPDAGGNADPSVDAPEPKPSPSAETEPKPAPAPKGTP